MSLSNLPAKDWNNLDQLVQTSVKNTTRPYSNADIYKNLLDFMTQVKTHYKVKEELMIQLNQSIEDANTANTIAIAEKSIRNTRATSKALEKAMASKTAASDLSEEFTLNRKRSTESLSTISISSDGIELDNEKEAEPFATRKSKRRYDYITYTKQASKSDHWKYTEWLT